jgi:serine/threonine-protein kinase
MASGGVEGEDPLIGRTFAGKYTLETMLGQGAMGAVYRARQIDLDKTVAIKVLHRELAADATVVERFRREAKAASRLEHPNSIRVFDFGREPDGVLYLAMEYLAGQSLLGVMQEAGRLPPQAVVHVLSQVLSALSVAHELGIFHRDLKPENIMIVEGRGQDGELTEIVKVCDFGIAKILEPDAPQGSSASPRKGTTTGIVVGTPDYMSPEQARGQRVDGRSDLYSVGVILYELLAGQVPFQGQTPLDVVVKHVSEPPAPPSSVQAGVDSRLEAVCLKALEKQAADRFPDARAMRQALREAVVVEARGSDAAPRVLTLGRLSVETPAAKAAREETPTFDAGLVHRSDPVPSPRRSGRAWILALAVALPAAGAIVFVVLHGKPQGQPAPPLVVEPTAAQAIPTAPSQEVAAMAAAPSSAAQQVTTGTTRATARINYAAMPHEKPRPVEVAAPPAVTVAAPPPAPETAAPSLPPPLPVPASAPPANPPPAAAALAAQAQPIAAPPPLPAYDLSTAHVVLGNPTNVSGATSTGLSRTVGEASSTLTGCYRQALPRLTGAIDGRGKIHIETDGAGYITDARASGPGDAPMATCIASALHGRRVPNVDTGSASADIPVEYRAR